jgi:hypothetical protein
MPAINSIDHCDDYHPLLGPIRALAYPGRDFSLRASPFIPRYV